MSQEVVDFPKLELVSTIGFAGRIPEGLHVHPDRQHLIYALGNTVVIEDLSSKQQYFLSGHTNNVSCISVSRSGHFIASGQVTHMGFKADVIVWDYATKSQYCKLNLHKVKVEAVAFSPTDKYLVTLGGQDDGSIVLWNLSKKEAVCGAPAAVLSAGNSYTLAFANNDDELFVSGGNKNIRVWDVDEANRKIRPTDCNMGQLKRTIRCIKMDENDKFFYCGTDSGDILQVNAKTRLLSSYGPDKDRFSQGVRVLQLMSNGEILVGAGDGTIAVVAMKEKKFRRVQKGKTYPKVDGEVTSLALRGQGHQFFVGTCNSEIHRVNYDGSVHELISTNHNKQVNDIVFPSGYNKLFVTCSEETIRVWNLNTNKSLLTIRVPNMVCNAVQILNDGRSIISGWNDNKIRAFTPESGAQMYAINDAHNKGVTAIAATSDCTKIISGGGEGQVRIWDISQQRMIEAMKEHKGIVTCIQVMGNDKECVTSSEDGTCIIWSLKTFCRVQIIFSNTLFKAVCCRPDILQVIATGTDRKISYWVTVDGSQIRELEGSKSGSIEGMDISPDGRYFVTGGKDKLIKVWKYDAGEVTHVGIGHAGDITSVKICPQQQWIVSVSGDGAIMRWKFPFSDALEQQMTL